MNAVPVAMVIGLVFGLVAGATLNFPLLDEETLLVYLMWGIFAYGFFATVRETKKEWFIALFWGSLSFPMGAAMMSGPKTGLLMYTAIPILLIAFPLGIFLALGIQFITGVPWSSIRDVITARIRSFKS